MSRKGCRADKLSANRRYDLYWWRGRRCQSWGVIITGIIVGYQQVLTFFCAKRPFLLFSLELFHFFINITTSETFFSCLVQYSNNGPHGRFAHGRRLLRIGRKRCRNQKQGSRGGDARGGALHRHGRRPLLVIATQATAGRTERLQIGAHESVEEFVHRAANPGASPPRSRADPPPTRWRAAGE